MACNPGVSSGRMASGAGPPSASRLGSQEAVSRARCRRTRCSSRRARLGRPADRGCRSARRSAARTFPRSRRVADASDERGEVGEEPLRCAEAEGEEGLRVGGDVRPAVQAELALDGRRHAFGRQAQRAPPRGSRGPRRCRATSHGGGHVASGEILEDERRSEPVVVPAEQPREERTARRAPHRRGAPSRSQSAV